MIKQLNTPIIITIMNITLVLVNRDD